MLLPIVTVGLLHLSLTVALRHGAAHPGTPLARFLATHGVASRFGLSSFTTPAANGRLAAAGARHRRALSAWFAVGVLGGLGTALFSAAALTANVGLALVAAAGWRPWGGGGAGGGGSPSTPYPRTHRRRRRARRARAGARASKSTPTGPSAGSRWKRFCAPTRCSRPRFLRRRRRRRRRGTAARSSTWGGADAAAAADAGAGGAPGQPPPKRRSTMQTCAAPSARRRAGGCRRPTAGARGPTPPVAPTPLRTRRTR
ncbi:hypothetical protein BU14_0087s0043 [Porphyra umbilicalis]|uniref:Uncharacterized protein n=1 Tax=Porphyra umbilicalis TaxID=2786 RepID=A0A1X6PEC3_PORUM|nr:hypothetical protein BU14_0087s0043 [Porphyra umbilicalis]|eukprot:OSX79096.1 hypothetical protein BU14_0087s0043 [Porphyra umbilicalis]